MMQKIMDNLIGWIIMAFVWLVVIGFLYFVYLMIHLIAAAFQPVNYL